MGQAEGPSWYVCNAVPSCRGPPLFRRHDPAPHITPHPLPPAEAGGSDEGPEQQVQDIADLDMDEFLNGTFLNADGSDGSSSDGGAGSDEEEGGSGDELGSGSDDEDAGAVAGANGAGGGKEEESESDDGAEGSDDEDGVGAQNARFKDEITAHKAQLEKLKEADPEFYQYLAATDSELLAFGAGESDSEGEEEEEEEEEVEAEEEEEAVEPEKPAAEAATADKGMVTLAQVDSWCAAALSNASQGAMRSLLRAYRVACHHGDTEADVAESLRLGSSAAYNRLMLFVLREADGIFKRMLGCEGEEPEAAALPRLTRWKKVEPLIKSYVGNTLHLLGEFSIDLDGR
jgi:nucleolar complex protein 2